MNKQSSHTWIKTINPLWKGKYDSGTLDFKIFQRCRYLLLYTKLGVEAAINSYAWCHKECTILRLDEFANGTGFRI